MINLSAKIRQDLGKKVKALREKGVLPSVLYGPKIKNQSLAVDLKEFEKVYQEAGESTLISLEVEGTKDKYLVLIQNPTKDPLSEKFLHVDFYQPSLEKEIEADIPIILEGEPPAVKNLGGTLIKNIQELQVKALPQNLPKEIKVDVSSLETFEDNILIKNLNLPKEVTILRESGDVVAQVTPPEKVEEELEKPIEENVEEVERVEKRKKEEEEEISPKEDEPRVEKVGQEKKK